ncbi:hypothetical protein Ctob_008694, partial [Chrysochromulina tobinii]
MFGSKAKLDTKAAAEKAAEKAKEMGAKFGGFMSSIASKQSTTYDFESGVRMGISLAGHSHSVTVVTEVADGTLAQQKGIKVGMVLLAVNDESVKGISKDGAMEIVMRYANTTRRLTFTNEPLTLAE